MACAPLCRVARALGLLFLAITCACASGPPPTGSFPDSVTGKDVYSRVELVVGGIKKEEADALYRMLFDRKVVRSITFEGYQNGVATYELDMAGCECELPAFISTIHSPGLRYGGRTTQMRYTAYDNQPPDVAVVYPDEGATVLVPEVGVTLAIEAQDVAEVRVNGVQAERVRGAFYRAPVQLSAGQNELAVVAKDRSGNEVEKHLKVKLDTTPGAREPEPKVIEGSVDPGSVLLIQGHLVPLDAAGRYRQELVLRRGQRDVKLTVVGPRGEVRSILRTVD
jgi:hypothetical protein